MGTIFLVFFSWQLGWWWWWCGDFGNLWSSWPAYRFMSEPFGNGANAQRRRGRRTEWIMWETAGGLANFSYVTCAYAMWHEVVKWWCVVRMWQGAGIVEACCDPFPSSPLMCLSTFAIRQGRRLFPVKCLTAVLWNFAKDLHLLYSSLAHLFKNVEIRVPLFGRACCSRCQLALLQCCSVHCRRFEVADEGAMVGAVEQLMNLG